MKRYCDRLAQVYTSHNRSRFHVTSVGNLGMRKVSDAVAQVVPLPYRYQVQTNSCAVLLNVSSCVFPFSCHALDFLMIS